MPWRVYTASAQIENWIDGLTPAEQNTLMSAIELLEEHGPTLGRPAADRVSSSRHQKMKELRPRDLGGAVLRVLFAFDSERGCALLVGGDKAEQGQWNDWYATWIPVADELFSNIEAQAPSNAKRQKDSRKGKGKLG